MKVLVIAVWSLLSSVVMVTDACTCAWRPCPRGDRMRDIFCSSTLVVKAKIVSGRLEPVTGKPIEKYLREKNKDCGEVNLYTSGYFGDVKYSLAVETVFRGKLSPGKQEILTNVHDSMCGVHFVRGKTYVIYGVLSGGKLRTDLCRGSHVYGKRDASLTNLHCGASRENGEPSGEKWN